MIIDLEDRTGWDGTGQDRRTCSYEPAMGQKSPWICNLAASTNGSIVKMEAKN